MKLLSLFAALLFLAPAAQAATPEAAYIHDIEGLLKVVESRDASRPQLTLKLADALFNEAVTLSGLPSMSEAEAQHLKSDRRRAVQLYQDALSGLKGLFPVLTGNARGKVQFQLARLYTDLGEHSSAEVIWRELAANETMPDIQREALLRLAEILENRASNADLKQAEVYYKKALALCTSFDVCSYSHYRLAWIFERQNQWKSAVNEMDLALWDSKGQVREEALRDMMAFLGSTPDDGKDATSKVEVLSAKLKNPRLLGDLSDAYFAHGNRKAGVYVLDAVNRKEPTLKGYVRLMEEDYGFRDWDKFHTELDGAVEAAAKTGIAAGDVETEKVLRRLTVQLDGERVSQPKTAEAFQKTVMLYLSLFPGRPERTQMIDGWLASETDDAAKIKQLQVWIGEEHQAGRTKEEIRLRKMRASSAQKAKDFPVVAEEMAALGATATTSTEKRESAYQLAYAQYQNKNYDVALPQFVQLADPPVGTATPDHWALTSEHLALDILAQKKDYAGVVAQAEVWTKDPRFASWQPALKDHQDEFNDVKKIQTSAQFEWATSLGSTKPALDVFMQDCMQNVLLPQSCANAQILAVKLGEQASLLELLKKLGKNDELANELEASAQFAEAAKLIEKKLADKGTTNRDYLKAALLYELGGSQINRDRILHQLEARIVGTKSLGAEEDLILQTFRDADLVNLGFLKLPWKQENRDYLMDSLVLNGKANADIQAQLVKSCRDTGSAWEKLALSELRKMDDKQKQIHFAGNGSKRKFEVRVASLKALGEKGNCYLQSSTPQARAVFATLLANAEAGLADEIKASPIPDGVDEDGKISLQKALVEMAQPFSDKGQEFEKLAQVQLDKIEDVAVRQALKEKISAKDESFYTALDAKPTVATAGKADPSANLSMTAKNTDVLNRAVEELHHNPNRRSAMVDLKSYYESAGSPRLAAYFQGRLLQLGEEGKQ